MDPAKLSKQVDKLAEEMGIKWPLMDVAVRYQVQAMLAQAVAQSEIAENLRHLDTRSVG